MTMSDIFGALNSIPNQVGTCVIEIVSGTVLKVTGIIDFQAAETLHQIIRCSAGTVNDEPIKKISIKQSDGEYTIVFDESLAYAILTRLQS
jgi:hypothetical protein